MTYVLHNPLSISAIAGVALSLDQVRAGLCELCRERRVRGEHGAPHLAAGGQPHHRLRGTPPTPRLGHFAQREYYPSRFNHCKTEY